MKSSWRGGRAKKQRRGKERGIVLFSFSFWFLLRPSFLVPFLTSSFLFHYFVLLFFSVFVPTVSCFSSSPSRVFPWLLLIMHVRRRKRIQSLSHNFELVLVFVHWRQVTKKKESRGSGLSRRLSPFVSLFSFYCPSCRPLLLYLCRKRKTRVK